jgi:type IV pilus assembly protein PilO
MANPTIDFKALSEKILSNVKFGRNKNETTLILIAAVVVFATIYFFVLINPIIISIFGNLKDISVYKTDVKQVKDSLGREDSLKKELETMYQEVTSYEKRLPTKREIPMILEELSRVAKMTNLKIIAISPVNKKVDNNPKDKIEEKPYQEIPISITAQGGYHAIGAFINKMETGSRFIKVSKLGLASNSQDAKNHDLELVVSTYILLAE